VERRGDAQKGNAAPKPQIRREGEPKGKGVSLNEKWYRGNSIEIAEGKRRKRASSPWGRKVNTRPRRRGIRRKEKRKKWFLKERIQFRQALPDQREKFN